MDCGWYYITKPKPTPKPTLKPTTPKPTPLPEHRPKCLHPKNYGAYCDEGCPERNDFGNSPFDIAVAVADYIDCEYHSDVVKKKEEMKKIKDMTDSELIDEYINMDETLEAQGGFGFAEGAGMDEWNFIKAEIKRRGITDNQIETRRKHACRRNYVTIIQYSTVIHYSNTTNSHSLQKNKNIKQDEVNSKNFDRSMSN